MIFHLLFSSLLFLLANGQAFGKSGQCEIFLNRIFAPTNNYVMTCDCPNPSGAGLDVLSRVQVDDPVAGQNTAAQVAATIRCAQRRNATLARVCEQNPSAFEKRATRVFDECVSVKPSKKDRRKKGPFMFDRSGCKAFLGKLLEPERSAAVWLCICSLENYRVIPTRAEFFTTGSPIGEREEVLFLESCSEKSKEQMTRVCKRRTDEFAELGKKKLQRCCRRARKGTVERDLCVPESVER